MTSDEIQAEVNGLKNLLGQTDYKILQSLESLFSSTSATGFVSGLRELGETLSEILANRRAWRERINELEAMTAEDEAPAEAVIEETPNTEQEEA